jgi:hypothetical protein
MEIGVVSGDWLLLNRRTQSDFNVFPTTRRGPVLKDPAMVRRYYDKSMTNTTSTRFMLKNRYTLCHEGFQEENTKVPMEWRFALHGHRFKCDCDTIQIGLENGSPSSMINVIKGPTPVGSRRKGAVFRSKACQLDTLQGFDRRQKPSAIHSFARGQVHST